VPSIEENIKAWGNREKWETQLSDGDKWSNAWGSVDMQWYGSLLPRIHKFLPSGNHARTILEIAPGYGRWPQYLQALCDRLVLVDLNQNCIEACKARFAHLDHIEYYVNDGRSLSMIADHSIDFVFSFDSLVHVEVDVIDDYLAELARVLTATGSAFLHHSNLGAVIDRVEKGEIASHWRAKSVTANIVRSAAEHHGLTCLSQELFNWGNPAGAVTDCFTSLTAKPASDSQEFKLIESDFGQEVAYIKNLAQVYSK
jgi:ubiquinone/menaquinone biosynthesis C-methylase UbiE